MSSKYWLIGEVDMNTKLKITKNLGLYDGRYYYLAEIIGRTNKELIVFHTYNYYNIYCKDYIIYHDINFSYLHFKDLLNNEYADLEYLEYYERVPYDNYMKAIEKYINLC